LKINVDITQRMHDTLSMKQTTKKAPLKEFFVVTTMSKETIRQNLRMRMAGWIRNQLAGGAGNFFSAVQVSEISCLLSDLKFAK